MEHNCAGLSEVRIVGFRLSGIVDDFLFKVQDKNF